VLLVTNRPAIEAWISTVPQEGGSIAVDSLPLRVEAVKNAMAVARATVAVVDAEADPPDALEICRELRSHRPQLPVAAFFCCTNGVTPWHLETLWEAGVRGILDLEGNMEEIGGALHRLAQGQTQVPLQLGKSAGPQAAGPRNLRRPQPPGLRLGATDVSVLSKLAQGLSDREIAARLHRSPHTIKHYVERLREAVGARNRIELAAWAGRHGFDQPSSSLA
jgi:DNA-binding NarL/FixJ family response regulator